MLEEKYLNKSTENTDLQRTHHKVDQAAAVATDTHRTHRDTPDNAKLQEVLYVRR